MIFGLLGPPIGWVALALPVIPATGSLLAVLVFLLTTSLILPFAYVIGLAPALVTGMVDARFAEQQTKWRPVWTAVAGFFATLLIVIFPGWAIGLVQRPRSMFFFCVLGAISGFVCALLCADPKRR